jgi:hypothetical protein
MTDKSPFPLKSLLKAKWTWAAAFFVLGAAALLLVPAPLLQNWLPNSTVQERGRLLGTAAQIVLLGLGGVIAIVGVTLSLYRHQQEREAAERDRERLIHDREKETARRAEAQLQRRADAEREMRARFVTAVDLLSASQPTKRTAALYALAALADDWNVHGRPDEVQVCVDVLCGYLRAPLAEELTSTPADEIAVKTTGFKLIGNHLSEKPAHSWRGLRVDLAGAYIDFPVSLDSVWIDAGGLLSFERATIIDGGRLHLSRILLDGVPTQNGDQHNTSNGGKISMTAAVVSKGCHISIGKADIDGGALYLNGVSLDEDGQLTLTDTTVNEGTLWMREATINGRSSVTFAGSTTVNRNGQISLSGTAIDGGGVLCFVDLTVSGGQVDGSELEMTRSGKLLLLETRINGGGAAVLLGGATMREGNALTLKGVSIDPSGPIRLPDGTRLL